MKHVIIISILISGILTAIFHGSSSKNISNYPVLPEILDSNKVTKVQSGYNYKSVEYSSIVQIPTEPEYIRLDVDSGSFADYLRYLEFKQDHPKVLLYDGSLKSYQGSQLQVIDIDVGETDLQQCADAVMRLRAEYQLSTNKTDNIGFHFLNGQLCDYKKYAEGYRIAINGNKTWWVKEASPNYSYKTFRQYMDLVFTYCNTHSMIKEMKNIPLSAMQIGDVFIRKYGAIGHAMVVVDMSKNKLTGEKQFMLAQSYMPAQEMHVVINPSKSDNNPWYDLNFEGNLQTPEWVFSDIDLYRFQD